MNKYFKDLLAKHQKSVQACKTIEAVFKACPHKAKKSGLGVDTEECTHCGSIRVWNDEDMGRDGEAHWGRWRMPQEVK